jgi:hypothetical protein
LFSYKCFFKVLTNSGGGLFFHHVRRDHFPFFCGVNAFK